MFYRITHVNENPVDTIHRIFNERIVWNFGTEILCLRDVMRLKCGAMKENKAMKELGKLKVCIVDDHKLFREGLKLLLSTQDFVQHIYEASNGKEFLDSLSFMDCDVVLMDIEMPVMNGLEATEAALRMKPGMKVIVLSMYGEEQYYYKMVDAGVKGFVLKSAGIEKVIAAIRAVAEGDSYFSEELLRGILNNMRDGAKVESSDSEISGRELEILYHVCLGLSNQEIADKLFISKRTVDKHRANLLSKTGCRNTAALVMYAIRNKMVEV